MSKNLKKENSFWLLCCCNFMFKQFTINYKCKYKILYEYDFSKKSYLVKLKLFDDNFILLVNSWGLNCNISFEDEKKTKHNAVILRDDNLRDDKFNPKFSLLTKVMCLLCLYDSCEIYELNKLRCKNFEKFLKNGLNKFKKMNDKELLLEYVSICSNIFVDLPNFLEADSKEIENIKFNDSYTNAWNLNSCERKFNLTDGTYSQINVKNNNDSKLVMSYSTKEELKDFEDTYCMLTITRKNNEIERYLYYLDYITTDEKTYVFRFKVLDIHHQENIQSMSLSLIKSISCEEELLVLHFKEFNNDQTVCNKINKYMKFLGTFGSKFMGLCLNYDVSTDNNYAILYSLVMFIDIADQKRIIPFQQKPNIDFKLFLRSEIKSKLECLNINYLNAIQIKIDSNDIMTMSLVKNQIDKIEEVRNNILNEITSFLI